MARILVVDDDEQVCGFIRNALDRAGHEVMEACNGEEAVTCFRNNPADLIITDILMPDKEGLETIMNLRGISPGVKIIVISGGGRFEPKGYLNVALQLGAHRAFTKPIEVKGLLKAVQELLSEAAP